MNIKLLIQALQKFKINSEFINENSFKIEVRTLEVQGNIVRVLKNRLRFIAVYEFLIILHHDNLLNCSDAALLGAVRHYETHI